MEPNQGFWQKNSQYIVPIAIIIVLAIVLFATQRGKDDQAGDEAQNEQTNQNTNSADNNPNPAPTPAQTPTPTATGDAVSGTTGNVTAAGTLRISDNASRGNLMVESNRSKIYIATRRNFSSLIGKPVNLVASGSLNSFSFLGFKESGIISGIDTEARGGAAEGSGTVIVSGKLANSDNMAKGNYVINSTSGKIYLKSVHNYSVWVGSDVTLTATGVLNSFSNAKLIKK